MSDESDETLMAKAILKIEELTDELREAEAYINDCEREIESLNYQLHILARINDLPEWEGSDS